MLKRIIRKVIDRIKYRFVLFYVFEKLRNIGFDIQLFYIHIVDDIHTFKNLAPKINLGNIEGGYLSLSEIDDIYVHPESKWLSAEKTRNLEEKCRCFGLKLNGKIACYSWLNFTRCHEVYPFPIKEDEVYETGVFTFKAYRGRNLPLFLKAAQYNEFIKLGRTKLIGIKNVLNTPSIRYERKIGGRPINIIIYINIFKKYKWTKKIKSPRKFITPF